MPESTTERAWAALFVVGSGAAALLIVFGVIKTAELAFGVDPGAAVDWLTGLVAATIGGAGGYKLFTDKRAD